MESIKLELHTMMEQITSLNGQFQQEILMYTDFFWTNQVKINIKKNYKKNLTPNNFFFKKGTYFYHVHNYLRADNLIGALNVYGKKKMNPYYRHYTTDNTILFSSILSAPSPTLNIENDLGYVRFAETNTVFSSYYFPALKFFFIFFYIFLFFLIYFYFFL